MRYPTIVACLCFVVSIGCRDGPAAVEPTAVEPAADPTVAVPIASKALPSPLSLVAGLPNDGVLWPLFERALEPAVVDKVAVALKLLTKDSGEEQLLAVAFSLGSLQRSLTVAQRPDVPAFLSDPETDPEAAIIADVLTLVVDDALETVMTAADSSGT